MVHAQLGIAEENSGKLVSCVRNEARKLGDERGLDLILTDGPPGIGCPVIASLGNATAVVNAAPSPASLLVLRDNVGGTAYYRAVDRYAVSVYETETLSQRRVGLTLVLLGGNEENPGTRLVIHALPVEEKEVATAQD